MDVADEDANDKAFGRPLAQRGKSAFPQIRFVSLVENGTHVLFGSQMGGYGTSEMALGERILPWLGQGMLCLADLGGFENLQTEGIYGKRYKSGDVFLTP